MLVRSESVRGALTAGQVEWRGKASVSSVFGMYDMPLLLAWQRLGAEGQLVVARSARKPMVDAALEGRTVTAGHTNCKAEDHKRPTSLA